MENEELSMKSATCNKPTLFQLFGGDMQPKYFTKLPEWDGFWFKFQKDVFVFTRNNELLKTPDYETFGKRDDWEQVVSSSPYRFALAKRFIKTSRVRLDEILTRIGDLPGNRETSAAKTSVQLAFMFLGLELAHLGSENPYPESMNPKNSIIENPQDKWDGNKTVLLMSEPIFISDDENNSQTGIPYTKWLRQELQYSQDVIKAYKEIIRPNKHVHSAPEPSLNLDTVIVRITEGKLWLGQQLNNYHQEQLAQQIVKGGEKLKELLNDENSNGGVDGLSQRKSTS